jgi:hypothetical protein
MLEIAVFALNYLTEYCTLVARVGRHASDFWTAYYDNWTDSAFRPISFLSVLLSELPQVRLHRNVFFCTIRSQATSGCFCPSSSPATNIDTGLPRLPTLDARRFQDVHGKLEFGSKANGIFFRATFCPEKTVRGWEHFEQSRRWDYSISGE